MFAFIRVLLGGLVSIGAPLVIRVLAALGLGFAAYSGISVLLDELLDMVQGNINALGSQVLQYVAVFNVDRFMTMVFSAFVIRLVFMGMSSAGVISRMQWRGGA